MENNKATNETPETIDWNTNGKPDKRMENLMELLDIIAIHTKAGVLHHKSFSLSRDIRDWHEQKVAEAVAKEKRELVDRVENYLLGLDSVPWEEEVAEFVSELKEE